MTSPTYSSSTTSIHPATEVGLLALSVADLNRSIAFYYEAIGFDLLEQRADEATLGAGGKPLLVLRAHPDATPWPRDGASFTGLYHFAILLPTRADLGRWLRHWLDLGFPLPGQGDHLVSEALYLEDPDGHGIEVYRDRPREQWQWRDGQVRMATDPVDIRGLLAEAARADDPWTGLPAGTKLGHVHLQVGDIPQAERFYRELLGFDVVVRMPTALFVSAGGYHHHLGMNTWHSHGAAPPPSNSVRLHYFTVDLPSAEARQAVLDRFEAAGLPVRPSGMDFEVQDPWGNTIVLRIVSLDT